ncbi:MAG: alpha-1,2-fucosyltransferase [Bacteroidales bacterium]|nr:alpha-1,2-fucosyltransferase [Bacteroidales bacterium]
MFKTIVFNGGLGNQMFQYAFYLQLKKIYPIDIFLFDIEQSQGCHNGFELDKIFHTESLKNARNYRRIKRRCPWLLNQFQPTIQEHSYEYDKAYLKTSHLLVRYEGYWQSEKYFSPIKQDIQRSFSFRMDLLNNETQNIAREIIGKETISVHIRRGDYLPLPHFCKCSIDYYKRAMSYMTENLNSTTFLFFSDDINWVKENIPCTSAIYVSCNHDSDSWQDMYLMTQCKHNIIANSTFSWWGAWLNKNPNKKVIAPARWLNDSPLYDVIPQGWITL